MTTTLKTEKPSNRRNYFRVNQDVMFDCRPADHYSAHNGSAETLFDDINHSLVAQLRKIDAEAAQNLKVLADKDPVLGDYLQTLGKKVDLIARHTLLAQTPPEHASAKRINLSEAGIAFDSDKAFYKGKFLAVRLVFLPNYASLMAFVEVVRCQSSQPSADGADTNESYQVAARFHRLSDADRQLISRQIIKAQRKHKN